MKRFAVILIIAVLAFGCVFAGTATGSTVSGKDTASNGTNNEKFVVKTKIGSIYPVYQIVGTGSNSTTATSAASSYPEIEGVVSTDADGKEWLSVSVELDHFGVTDNDLAKRASKTNIRYKGAVEVTITAGTLINQRTNASSTATEYVYSSGDAVVGTTPWTAETFSETTDNFTCALKGTATANTATFTATYANGKKVATAKNAVKIASGSFKWDITDLTAGDTYKADVTVTYTAQ